MIVGAHVYHIEVVLDEFGPARRVHTSEQSPQGCLGYVSPSRVVRITLESAVHHIEAGRPGREA